MTTNHHTPYPFGGPLTAAAMEAPLGQLDAAIAAVIATGSGASTTLTAQALAGQASLTVASSAGFAVGDPIYVGTGATFESRIIATIPNGTTITVTVNLSNTYASGSPVSKSPVEIVDARGTYGTLGGRMTAVESRVFDVKRYGAKGDGATDDSATIQAAIDAAAAAGGMVFVPPGVYRIVTSLVAKSNVVIAGTGYGSILRAASAISLIRGSSVTNARVELLHLDGNQAVPGGASDADAVLFDGASVGSVVRGCYIEKSARDGIAFRNTSRGCAALDNVLENIREDGITMNGEAHRVIGNHMRTIAGDGVLIKGASRCVIMANSIDTPGATTTAAGISLGGDGVGANDHNAIIGNTITGASGHSIFINEADYCLVEGNVVRSGASNGIECATNVAAPTIIGNVIEVVTGRGINASSTTTDPRIEGNYIRDPGNRGIYAGGARAIIVGNTVDSAGERGILVEGSQGVIADNLVRNSASEGILINNATDLAVTGNRSYDDQGVKTQSYGIRSVGSSDFLAVVGNVARGNLTGSISLVGAGNVNANNVV